MKKNGPKYGWHQPYTQIGSKSESGTSRATCTQPCQYMEERWHWSYTPLSVIMRKEWLKEFGGVANKQHWQEKVSFIDEKAGSPLVDNYVTNVDLSCQ